jgi:hypothetical protein
MNNPWMLGTMMALVIVVLVSGGVSFMESQDNVVKNDPRSNNTYVIEYRNGVNGFGETMLREIYSDNVTINDDGIIVDGFYEWKGTRPENLLFNSPYDWIYTDNITVIPKSGYLMKKYVK